MNSTARSNKIRFESRITYNKSSSSHHSSPSLQNCRDQPDHVLRPAGTSFRHMDSNWTVLVFPHASLTSRSPPILSPRLDTQSDLICEGVILPLQETLSRQLLAIAQHYSFPSLNGISLHLDVSGLSKTEMIDGETVLGLSSDSPEPTNQDHYPAKATSGSSPQITDESWRILFQRQFKGDDLNPPELWPRTNTGSLEGIRLPIAARLQFKIDPMKAEWYHSWFDTTHSTSTFENTSMVPRRLSSVSSESSCTSKATSTSAPTSVDSSRFAGDVDCLTPLVESQPPDVPLCNPSPHSRIRARSIYLLSQRRQYIDTTHMSMSGCSDGVEPFFDPILKIRREQSIRRLEHMNLSEPMQVSNTTPTHQEDQVMMTEQPISAEQDLVSSTSTTDPLEKSELDLAFPLSQALACENKLQLEPIHVSNPPDALSDQANDQSEDTPVTPSVLIEHDAPRPKPLTLSLTTMKVACQDEESLSPIPSRELKRWRRYACHIVPCTSPKEPRKPSRTKRYVESASMIQPSTSKSSSKHTRRARSMSNKDDPDCIDSFLKEMMFRREGNSMPSTPSPTVPIKCPTKPLSRVPTTREWNDNDWYARGSSFIQSAQRVSIQKVSVQRVRYSLNTLPRVVTCLQV